jgi:hypothetical protein
MTMCADTGHRIGPGDVVAQVVLLVANKAT